MARIRQSDLEWRVKRINEITKSPETGWTTNGKTTQSNIGHYHLSYAYGGVALERMVNEHGGVSRISTGGYGTKRELYQWLQAFIAGLTHTD